MWKINNSFIRIAMINNDIELVTGDLHRKKLFLKINNITSYKQIKSALISIKLWNNLLYIYIYI